MKFNLVSISRPLGRGALILRKHGPTIAFVGGVAGSITSTVLACKATLKLADELPEMKHRLEQAKMETKMGEDERVKDIAYVYTQNVLLVARLYAPAVIIGAASVGALTGSHVTLNRRNAGLTAAYAAVSKAYDEYRERVREELGDDKENDIYHGLSNEKIKFDGDSKKTEITTFDPNKRSPYSRIFDECSTAWDKNAEINRIFISCQQTYLNNRLHAYGYVFLNEAYEALGFERTKAGQVVGWMLGDDGDNFIDFGLFEAYNGRFVNGIERSIILDFNVDGVIFDKIR